MEARLGHRYRDRISGFEGVATGIFHYLHGCARVNLEGNVAGAPKGFVFDEPQLEDIGGPIFMTPAPAGSSGGPRPDPPRTVH